MYYQVVPMDRSHIPQIVQLEQTCFSVPWTENMLTDALFDPQASFIVAEDDEGNVEKYLHVGTIEYKGEWYCFFQKAEPETEEEEDEVVMFLLKGEGDEQELLPLEDETLMDEVFAEFCNQYEQYEDSDDAMKLDGADD